ncbi:MAG TPA: phage major capsid protein [Chthoniobacterales bacterium]|nr:phage major capsid protein [Chthoniobacterales bacterium]
MEWSSTLERNLSPKLKEMRSGNIGTLIPSSAFGLSTRAVTSGGSGGSMVGTKVQQLSGILGWSAVVRSGAQLLGPLKDDVRVFHDGNLPSATWLAETGAVLPADVSFTASTLSAKRVCAQIIVSKQLLTQSVGSVSLDQYLADKIRVAVASVLDQAALYGTGGLAPFGVIHVAGSQNVTVASPPVWADLAKMRFAVINYDANRDWFGWITSPNGRRYLEATARFAQGGTSLWDSMTREAELSLEVSDDRLFAGLWSYLVIGYWTGDSTGPATDLVIDQFSRAERGEVVITGSLFCDVAVRWPQLFGFTAATIFPP